MLCLEGLRNSLMRLRIFDWSTKYFWIVIFYQKRYGEPRIELSIYSPSKHFGWFNVWQWEDVPDKRGLVAECLEA